MRMPNKHLVTYCEYGYEYEQPGYILIYQGRGVYDYCGVPGLSIVLEVGEDNLEKIRTQKFKSFSLIGVLSQNLASILC